MDRSLSQQIVQSVVNFLRNELSVDGVLSSESAESVEVAIQCLETAYNLPCNVQPILSLTDIYREALPVRAERVEQTSEPQQQTSGAVSDADRAAAEVLKTQGNTYMGEENFEKSIECYTKAIEKDPTNAVYFCNRAAAQSKLNRHELAIEDCKKALELQPEYSKAYGRMGLAHSSLMQHRLARDCYKKALELEPGNEGFARNLSIAEQALESMPESNANPFADLLGGAGGAGLGGLSGAFSSSGSPNLAGLLSNPGLMNMATQLMSDPNMQNMLANMLGSTGGVTANVTASASASANVPPPPPPPQQPTPDPSTQTPPAGFPGMEALFSAGRQLAEQMQNQHPELLEQLRSQMGSGGGPQQQPPPNQ